MNLANTKIIEMFLIRALEKILNDKDIKKSYHSELRKECIKALGEIKELTKLKAEDVSSSILPSVLEKYNYSVNSQEESEISSTTNSIDAGDSHRDSLSQETYSIDGSNSLVDAEKYFLPFELACQSRCARIVIIALDCIQKLFAYGHLVGNGPDLYPKIVFNDSQDSSLNGDKDSEITEYNSDLAPFSLLCPSPGWKYNNDRLIDRIVRVICGCMDNQGVNEGVHLQIIKALLTVITSPRCQIHEGSLLLTVRTCYNIHLGSKSVINQTTAKATLNQMLSVIFGKMEAHSVEYCLKNCGLLGGMTSSSSYYCLTHSSPFQNQMSHNDETSLADVKSYVSQTQPHYAIKRDKFRNHDGDDNRYFLEDEIEASVVGLMEDIINRVEESLICVLGPEMGQDHDDVSIDHHLRHQTDPALSDGPHPRRPGTLSGTPNRVSRAPGRRPSYHGISDDHQLAASSPNPYNRDDTNDIPLEFDGLGSVEGGSTPIADVHAAKTKLYRCKVSYTLRRDAFLIFRALCRLALKPFASPGPSPVPASASANFFQQLSSSLGTSGSAASHNPKRTNYGIGGSGANFTGSHYHHHMLRSKTLSLQLLHSVLEQAGPVFCSEEPLFYKGACGHAFAALVPSFTSALKFFGSPGPGGVQQAAPLSTPPNTVTTVRHTKRSNDSNSLAQAQEIARNSGNSNDILTDVRLFETALALFATIVLKFKKNMKLQIEIFFREVYLNVLENPFPNEFKLLVLNALTTLCENPQNVVDLYVNYDCDLSATNIFSRLVSDLSRIAQHHPSAPEPPPSIGSGTAPDRKGSSSLRIVGLRCLVTISRCMALWCEDLYTADSPSVRSETGYSPPPDPEVADLDGGGEANRPHNSGAHDRTYQRAHSNSSATSEPATAAAAQTASKAQERPGSFRRRRSKAGPWNINTRADGFREKAAAAANRAPAHGTERTPNDAADTPTGPGVCPRRTGTSETPEQSVPHVGHDDHPARYEDMKRKKEIIEEGIAIFKKKPAKGLIFLQGNTTDLVGTSPEEIAQFLFTEPRLDKGAIGEYLGENDKFNKEVMYAYVDLMDFQGKGFVQALREFLERFKLPGEAQKVDRLMQKFAGRYVENNSSLELFQSADSAYVLAFSIIMLTTDLHNPQVKHKMTKEEYIRINKNTNDQKDLPESYLSQIYDEIAENRLKMKDKLLDNDKPLSDPTKNEFRSAMYIEHVRPMFKITWTPMLAAFSVSLQDCDEIEIVTLSLEGMKDAIRIACIFKLELERNAFIQALSHFTLLTAVAYPAASYSPQIKTKNLLTIRTLISIAQTDGNFLGSSWFDFLKCISQLELAQIIANRTGPIPSQASNVSSLSGHHHPLKFLGSKGDSRQTASSFEGSGTQGHHTSQPLANGYDETSSSAVPGSTTFRRSSTTDPDHDHAPSLVKDHLRYRDDQDDDSSGGGGGMDDHQSLLVEVDKVFTGSVLLNGDAIVDFVGALCRVSLEELSVPGSGSASQRAVGPAQSGGSINIRMFSLQKMVEISYYNMGRIRLQWTKIWAILGPHFNKVGCHPIEAVAFFSLDSLRQLSMKFLEKGELANFRFQKDFLRPFEYIMKNNTSINIADMTVRCVTQMIRSQAHNIKSGWKNVFSVFQIAASHPDENILVMAFQATTFVINNLSEPQFIYIVDSFQNAVKCLSEFACNSKFMDTNMEAIRLLRNSAQFVYDDPQAFKEFGHEEIAVDEDDYPWVKGWFPILFELSCVINRCSLDVRTRALTVMFDILKSFGHVFAPHWWKDFFRVLFRIFDNFKIPNAKSEKSEWMTTTCNHALYAIVDIFSQFYDPLCTVMLADFYEQLKWCLNQGNEQLARAALNCFENMVLTNGSKFKVREWDLTCKTIVDIFRDTLPYELLTYKTGTNVTTAPASSRAATSQFSIQSSSSISCTQARDDSSPLADQMGKVTLYDTITTDTLDAAKQAQQRRTFDGKASNKDPAVATACMAVQCVIQFELILCVERIIFHQYYPSSALDSTLSHAYYPTSKPCYTDGSPVLGDPAQHQHHLPQPSTVKNEAFITTRTTTNEKAYNAADGGWDGYLSYETETNKSFQGIRSFVETASSFGDGGGNAPDSPYAYPQYSPPHEGGAQTGHVGNAHTPTRSFYELMTVRQLVVVVEFLLESHNFAKSFNSDSRLRDTLHRSGFKGNAKPNLLKQETVSFALALNVLFRMYDDDRKQYEWPLIREKLIGHTLDALKYFLKIQSKAHRDSWNRIIQTLLTRLLITKDPKFRSLVLPLYTQLCELLTLIFDAEIRSLLRSLFLKIGVSFMENSSSKANNPPPEILPTITSFQQTRLI